jgi:hypothetical protein
MWKLVTVVFLGLCLWAFFDSPTPAPKPTTGSLSEQTSLGNADRPTNVGSGDEPEDETSTSSDWGSGHQAGYDWAEEHSISDESDCEEAGDHSNSPSFAEGCTAYVNGESH